MQKWTNLFKLSRTLLIEVEQQVEIELSGFVVSQFSCVGGRKVPKKPEQQIAYDPLTLCENP